MEHVIQILSLKFVFVKVRNNSIDVLAALTDFSSH